MRSKLHNKGHQSAAAIHLRGMPALVLLFWKDIAGMTFLDNRDRRVRDETAKNLIVSRVGAPLMSKLANTPLAKMKMPMSQAGKMRAL